VQNRYLPFLEQFLVLYVPQLSEDFSWTAV
jgi:hypothetical protein